MTDIKLYSNEELDLFIKSTFEWLDISIDTKNEYLNKIKSFVEFVQSNWFNENTFLNYKNFLKSRNDISVSTKNLHLTSARIMLKQMFKMWKLPVDITINTKSFKQTKKHKKFWVNEEELNKVSEYLSFLDSHITDPKEMKKIYRIKWIFSLLIFQWLRQIEIIRFDVEDVDLRNKVIYVLGKWRDDKEKINLHPISVQVLADYIKNYGLKSWPLFFSISNNWLNQRLTTRSLRRLVKDILTYLDIDKSTHWFRHYFTTKLLKDFKWDVMKTRKFTRHNSLEMLMVYNDEIDTESSLKDYYSSFDGISI